MDPQIWGKLPYDMVRIIIEMSEPSIDVRRAFGIKPKKLEVTRACRLWRLLKYHDGLIYSYSTKTLHNFVIPGVYIIRRPIELNYHTAGLWIFNDTEDEYIVEMIGADGAVICYPTTEPWVTERKVLLKG
jgi:hypothetical protein